MTNPVEQYLDDATKTIVPNLHNVFKKQVNVHVPYMTIEKIFNKSLTKQLKKMCAKMKLQSMLNSSVLHKKTTLSDALSPIVDNALIETQLKICKKYKLKTA